MQYSEFCIVNFTIYLHLFDLHMQNSSQYLQMYNQKRTLGNYTNTFAHTFAYDAVWALALALNRTDELLKSNTSIPECQDLPGYTNITLDLFKYNNAKLACILKSNLNVTNFVGVSVRVLLYFNLCTCIYIMHCFQGSVHFDADGTRVIHKISVLQYRQGWTHI